MSVPEQIRRLISCYAYNSPVYFPVAQTATAK